MLQGTAVELSRILNSAEEGLGWLLSRGMSDVSGGKEVCSGSFLSLLSPLIGVSSSVGFQQEYSVACNVHLSQGLSLPRCQLTGRPCDFEVL